VLIRYALRPHAGYDQAAAERFGIEQSQPLVAVPVDPASAPLESRLSVQPASVIVTMLRPVEQGRAWLVRLFNAADAPAQARLDFQRPAPSKVVLSSPFQDDGSTLSGPIDMPSLGIVTLKVQWDR